MQTLVLSDFGMFLGRKSERAVVKRPDGTAEEYPLFRLGEIVIAKRGVAISSDLISEAVKRGIRISFLDMRGEPYAMLSSPFLTATTATRRAQIEAFNDGRGLEYAKTIVGGKLRNQAALLKYSAKYLKTTDRKRYSGITQAASDIESLGRKARDVKGKSISEARDALLGIEGNAGKRYWEGMALLLKGTTFEKREHRGAEDLVNSMLNYGYGVLYSKIWGALLHAGLEPFAGFLHTDRPGKPSLVFDFIEEFRQPIVDRSILALVNKRVKLKVENGLLCPKTRRKVAETILGRFEGEVTFEGKRHTMNSVIQIQARHLATFLRGERQYRCYKFKW